MRKGFTLIEIIVVVAIIAVIMGAGVATYVSGNRSQDFDKDVTNFVDALHSARTKTTSRDVESDTCSENVEYYVTLPDDTHYEVWKECTNVNQITGIMSTTQNMLERTTFKVSKFTDISTDIVRFNQPYGTVTTDIALDVVSIKTNLCTTVTVNTIGTIDVIDFSC